MKQLLMMVAIAGLAVACSDDDNTVTVKTDAGLLDSGLTDGGKGPDSTVPLSIKVTNAGAACSSSTDCTGGSTAICETTSFTKATNPGGSCSAVCTSSAECGTGGVCPTGEAIANFGTAAITALGTSTGSCAQSCSAPGTATGCRTGYLCLTLNILAKQAGGTVVPGNAILDKPFCVSVPAAPVDGGVKDGGVTDASGIDSGK